MVGPYLVGVSGVASLCASVLAWRQTLAVMKSRGEGVATMTAQLKRVPLEERAAALLERAPENSWQREFAREVVEAPNEAWRIASANEAVSDLAHALDLRAAWPRAAARVSAVAALLCAIVAFLVDREFGSWLSILIPGAIGLAVCVDAGRRARETARICRLDMDALVLVVMGPIAREQADLSERRRRRRREAS